MPITAENRFYLRPFGQEDVEQDYHLLHVLSNSQVPQDPEGNREWQHNRRHFDETQRLRRHYIAHEGTTQEPVAYAAIEQQELRDALVAVLGVELSGASADTAVLSSQ